MYNCFTLFVNHLEVMSAKITSFETSYFVINYLSHSSEITKHILWFSNLINC